jgi:hypothetical protein
MDLLQSDKETLIDLVYGVGPHFDIFKDPTVARCGRYNGSYGTWAWIRSELNKLTEDELYALYKLCRDTWKAKNINK